MPKPTALAEKVSRLLEQDSKAASDAQKVVEQIEELCKKAFAAGYRAGFEKGVKATVQVDA